MTDRRRFRAPVISAETLAVVLGPYHQDDRRKQSDKGEDHQEVGIKSVVTQIQFELRLANTQIPHQQGDKRQPEIDIHQPKAGRYDSPKRPANEGQITVVLYQAIIFYTCHRKPLSGDVHMARLRPPIRTRGTATTVVSMLMTQ